MVSHTVHGHAGVRVFVQHGLHEFLLVAGSGLLRPGRHVARTKSGLDGRRNFRDADFRSAPDWFFVAFVTVTRNRDSWRRFEVSFELYVVTFCGTTLLPENLRPLLYAGWIGLLGSRLTTVSAILGLCLLALLKTRRWHLAGFGACALVFFVFLYQDTGWLNRLEASAEKLTSGLAPGTRVVVTIDAPAGSRIQFIHHSVERACIGRCFSYANYEPSTGEFRIRVREGSPVVTSSTDTAEDMASGEYEVDETDLPLKQIYQCDASDLTKLCIRDLAAGDDLNVEIGRKPGKR